MSDQSFPQLVMPSIDASSSVSVSSLGPGVAPGKASSPISEAVLSGCVGAYDAVSLVLAGLGSFASIRMVPAQAGAAPQAMVPMATVIGTVMTLNMLYLLKGYDFSRLRSAKSAIGAIVLAWSIAMILLVAVMDAAGAMTADVRNWLAVWSLSALGLLVLSRLGLDMQIQNWRQAGRLSRRVAVVGAGPLGQNFIRNCIRMGDPGVDLAGVYDDRQQRASGRCAGVPLLGTVDDLLQAVRAGTVDMVVVALPLSADWRLAEVLNKLSHVAVETRLCTDMFGFHLGSVRVSQMGGGTLLSVMEPPMRNWRGIAKTLEDRILGAVILLLIAPLMLAIAVGIKLDSPGPVLFRQKRYGLNNELIEVWKFRTMHHHAGDANAERLTTRDDPRVTRFGSLLRRTSLDELPQFINVIRGDMSIVGPRPHALSAKAGELLYREAVRHYDARHRMKPGITGWAQVNGWRGETRTVEQILKRVEHDIYYIEHWSVLFDLSIVLRTLFVGFTGRNVY